MARVARIVLPNTPHHVTQRGNRRQQTFFCDDDYARYLKLLRRWCERFSVSIDAFCLMPNHVHLILVPSDPTGLASAIAEIHRRYTQRVNEREGWIGHLWQGRFFSVPLDDAHYDAARRYVELNPVRAGLVELPSQYRWSSAHGKGGHSALATDQDFAVLRKMTRTGRPQGTEAFYDRIIAACGVDVRPKKPGPRPKKPT